MVIRTGRWRGHSKGLKCPPPPCPKCGLKYNDFKTGFSFHEVASMLWSNDPDPNTWKYRRRHTVLGKWHEIKMEMWRWHLEMCGEEPDPLSDEVPF